MGVRDLRRRPAGGVDVIEGRQGSDLDAWLARQPERWREGVEVTVTDLHEPFRQALAARLPNATAVADPFHVVGVGTRVVDRCRRRVQQETLGHRGHKHDPLYRGRKLLILAAERLDERGEAKLRGLLAAGDPDGEVHEAWQAEEALRDLYCFWGDEPVARQWLNALIADCRARAGPRSGAWPARWSGGGNPSWPGTPPATPADRSRA